MLPCPGPGRSFSDRKRPDNSERQTSRSRTLRTIVMESGLWSGWPWLTGCSTSHHGSTPLGCGTTLKLGVEGVCASLRDAIQERVLKRPRRSRSDREGRACSAAAATASWICLGEERRLQCGFHVKARDSMEDRIAFGEGASWASLSAASRSSSAVASRRRQSTNFLRAVSQRARASSGSSNPAEASRAAAKSTTRRSRAGEGVPCC